MPGQLESVEQRFREIVSPTQVMPYYMQGGALIWLADETKRLTGSFKDRGATWKGLVTHERSPELVEPGVVTASAGNHAQGVLLVGSVLDVPVDIFLPESVAQSKAAAIERRGAQPHRVPGTVTEALGVAEKFAANEGKLFIHPFNDEEVIDGQATLATELAEQVVDFDTVVVPVGGGGLLAGMLQALAEKSPQTKVCGAQLYGCDAFTQSVAAGEVVVPPKIDDRTDGTAVREVGTITLRRALHAPNFAGMIRVTPGELAHAIDLLDEKTDIVAETSAALSYAGLTKYLDAHGNPSGDHLAVITGRHRDNSRLARLRED